MKAINNKLKELRLKQGMKQGEIAILLSLQCENRICRWEKGTSMPSVENLFKLAEIYKVLPRIIYPDLFREEKIDSLDGRLTTQQMSHTNLQEN